MLSSAFWLLFVFIYFFKGIIDSALWLRRLSVILFFKRLRCNLRMFSHLFSVKFTSFSSFLRLANLSKLFYAPEVIINVLHDALSAKLSSFDLITFSTFALLFWILRVPHTDIRMFFSLSNLFLPKG